MRKRLRLRIEGANKGSQLPGTPSHNPKAGENIKFIEAQPEARYRGGVKPGEVRNPYGRKGYQGAGMERPMKRSPEDLKKTMEARELTEACRNEAERNLEVLREIRDSDTSADTAKLTAITIIMERAYGKATQTSVSAQVQVDGKPTEIDDAELNRRIEAATKRLEGVAGGEEGPSDSQDGPVDLRKLN